MLVKKSKKKGNYFTFSKFDSVPWLIQGVSSKSFGDMNVAGGSIDNPHIDSFLEIFRKSTKDLVMMEQTHEDRICVVNDSSRGKIIAGVDGLITETSGVLLGIKTADCLPLIYCDLARKVVGAAHAGYKGVLAGLPGKMISSMLRDGSSAKDIFIGIGPAIGGCCYDVNNGLEKNFSDAFGDLSGMIRKTSDKYYLNLTVPAIEQIVRAGGLLENIDLANECTACEGSFYSRRGQGRENYGHNLTVVGIIA